MKDLQKMYQRRFKKNIMFRKKMYSVLCKEEFSKYVKKNDSVLDVAAGYCEFINNIIAREKFALDINPDVREYAKNDVKIILSESTNMKGIKESSLDCVFVSNFFEHITKKDITKTIEEIYRVLKPNGKIIILQPNIRYCANDYWMFFDHITPLDDRSLVEILQLKGFKPIVVKSKFLPFSIKSKLPNSIFLLKIYLKIPIIQKLFGKQALIVAKKSL